MWLINTESLKLEYFIGNNIPKYAILSHTWGDGEVSFQDWQDLQEASKKPGFAKIKSACEQAQIDSLGYVWVDTNCIDKSSSAELSEAINSMFAWYKNSQLCYVYLADVGDPDGIAGMLGDGFDWDGHFDKRIPIRDSKRARFIESFRKSRWFTRGWTLQELLAPEAILFFTKEWSIISMVSRKSPQTSLAREASKARLEQKTLFRLISNITSIRLIRLSSPSQLIGCSNGEKMSWMASRHTTREEDLAYCLMGIFDINMPLIYGEGSKAFGRLQEEIIKQSKDHSLFAWQWPEAAQSMKGKYPNFFADSIRLFSKPNVGLLGHKAYFCDSSNANTSSDPLSDIITLTNFGLSISLRLISTAVPDYVFGVLDIKVDLAESRLGRYGQQLWCIPLLKIGKVYRRAPFPPGPIPVPVRRERDDAKYPIYIPRDSFGFSIVRDYQYAFVLVFPEQDIGFSFKVKSVAQIGDIYWNPARSTLFILRGAFQNEKIVASVLNISNELYSFLLFVGAREVDQRVRTAAKLFPAETSLDIVNSIQMAFRRPSFYRDECGSFSLVVNEGHHIDPIPPNSDTKIIFSISLYINQERAGEMTKSQGEDTGNSASEKTSDVRKN